VGSVGWGVRKVKMGILALTNEHHKRSGTLKKAFGALYKFQHTLRCYFRPRKEVVVDLEEVGGCVRSGGLASRLSATTRPREWSYVYCGNARYAGRPGGIWVRIFSYDKGIKLRKAPHEV
jgi:hypothetical protein